MQLHIDQNKKEIKTHGTWGFPVLVSHEWLSRFEQKTFWWHWHTELEWTMVLEGEISYQVNEQVYHLKAGQGLLCNSNMLHAGHSVNGDDCHYLSVTFHPRLLGGFENSFLKKNYVSKIIDVPAFAAVMLDPDKEWQKTILEHLKQIEFLYFSDQEDAEYQIYLLLMQSWLPICRYACNREEDTAGLRNVMRLQEILTYLHTHYQEKIVLQDIAERVNICSSECCRFFKKYMKETIFDYLLDYRIERSKAFLAEETSITEAGERAGFASSAYFTKVFRARTGCTPREYQRMQLTKIARKVSGSVDLNDT